jgi:hypothetical protein
MSDIIRNNTSETLVNFIMSNYKQVLLLIMVVLIIYSVEYMSYVNAMVYGMLAMPSIPGVTNSSTIPTNKKRKTKTKTKT